MLLLSSFLVLVGLGLLCCLAYRNRKKLLGLFIGLVLQAAMPPPRARPVRSPGAERPASTGNTSAPEPGSVSGFVVPSVAVLPEKPLFQFQDSESRYLLLPVRHPELFALYKAQQKVYWTVEEVDISKDLVQWNTKLTQPERDYISFLLAFFNFGDGPVGENLATRFYALVGLPEARAFYSIQLAQEQVHMEMYNILFETFIPDEAVKTRLRSFAAPGTASSIATKAEFIDQALQSDTISFEERLVRFVVIEGVFFSSSFCGIYWLKKRGFCPGLTFSNELISRDENLHVEFAVVLRRLLLNKTLTQRQVYAIFAEGVRIECEFVRESLPEALTGMNAELMCQYVRYVADYWLKALGLDPLYQSQNPFEFMAMIGVAIRANFFESKVSEYGKANPSVKLVWDD